MSEPDVHALLVVMNKESTFSKSVRFFLQPGWALLLLIAADAVHAELIVATGVCNPTDGATDCSGSGLPFGLPVVEPDGLRDHDSFVGWYRYPANGTDWEAMAIGPDGNPTAYSSDWAIAGVTNIHAIGDGDNWTARAYPPSGPTINWVPVTWYASYEGSSNCFVGWDGAWWEHCGLTSITITWYDDSVCRPAGEWTMTFFENCASGCSEVPYYSGNFTILPQIPDEAVPLYSQGDPAWRADPYDHWCAGADGSSHTCDGQSGETPYTIGRKGCFLTSLAMVLSYHGATVTPGELNTWLSGQSDGFTNGRVNVLAALRYARQAHGVDIEYRQGTAGDEATLRSYICRYGPQMIGQIGTAGTPNSHWLVAYGEDESGTTFYINDPATGESWDLDFWSPCNGSSFCGMHLFVPHSTNRSFTAQWAMFAQVDAVAPVELLITDSQGRRTGLDPTTGQSYNEISLALYGQSGQDAHEVEGDDDMAKELLIRKPATGTFELKVIGSGAGSYALNWLGYDTDLAPTQTTFADIAIAEGRVHTYRIDYASAPGLVPAITPECPFSCGDTDGDESVSLNDFAAFQACFTESPSRSIVCACADRGANGTIDLSDFAEFSNMLGGAAPGSESTGSACGDALDNDCDGAADCADADCRADPLCWACGNGRCDLDEDCVTCADCPGVSNGPPSDRYCCGNGILESAEGDGSLCDDNP